MSTRTPSRTFTHTSARHRSDAPASTPLTGAVSAIAATAPASAARSGAVLVVSSGLVAGVGLPAADAATSKPAGDPKTATLTLPAVTDNVVQQAVSAPATAQVTFERSALAAGHRPAAAARVDSAARTAANVVHASRSIARAAYHAQVARTAKLEQARRAAAAARAQNTVSVSRSTNRTSTSTRPSNSNRPSTSSRTASAPRSNGGRGSSVIAIASRYFGVPYVFGGTTPRGFDCSGLVQYVYAQLGVHLPRTTNQQYAAVTRISRSQAQPGDLVFFFGSGGISHMGIYAGNGMMIAAPRTGSVVQKQKIYSANVAYGRV